jgi:hypothetical protein
LAHEKLKLKVELKLCVLKIILKRVTLTFKRKDCWFDGSDYNPVVELYNGKKVNLNLKFGQLKKW